MLSGDFAIESLHFAPFHSWPCLHRGMSGLRCHHRHRFAMLQLHTEGSSSGNACSRVGSLLVRTAQKGLDIVVAWEIEGGVFKAVAATARLVHSRHVLRAALALFDCVSLLYPIL